MPALMFDSDNPAVLVTSKCDGCRIATYADLLTPELITAAGPRLVAIHRGLGDPHNLATVADIEDGALSVDAGVALIRQWNQEKRDSPTAYHDRAADQAVTQALGNEACFRWIATLDGTLVPVGMRADVVQFANATVTGFHADTSLVWNDAWRPQPAGVTPGQMKALEGLALQSAQAASQLLKEIRTA